ncbi:histidine kinase [Evansella sp. AB-rgal1]|uniref:sensor histidine kinase n=1 Tax=Evansella sp. AB-rgal1 TaxID=3242696 RepID=UPI00359E8ABF
MKINKLQFSSLRTKLLVMFILLTVVPLIIVGMVSYSKAVEIISENAQSKVQLESTQLSQEIDGIIQDTIRFTEIGKKESTINFLMEGDDTVSYEDAKSILQLFAFYREIIPTSQHVLDISIISNRGRAISERKGVYHYLEDPTSIGLDNTEQLTKTKITTTSVNSDPVISITRPIIWDITYEVIGYFNILLDSSIIESLLNSPIETTGTFLIYSEQNDEIIIYPSEESLPNNINEILHSSNDFETIKLNDSLFIVNHTSNVTGWNVIGLVPESVLLKGANDIKNLIIGTVASSLIFTITLYHFISARLILPIRTLKEKMKLAASGNLNAKVPNESGDEIAELGASFNIMIRKIKTLLEKSVNEEKKLKKAELKTLQAQINPHFLYNTLDTIIWMAEAKKGNDVISITKALSNFFRISLSKGKDLITIYQEIEHIKSYLVIQKTRYRDILEVTFDVNEQIYNYIILKITLQPLIENAIYHGIKNKRGKGYLHIEGDFDKHGNINFTIIDNGIGIGEQNLINIRNHLYNGYPLNNSNGGFGMYNVQERIRLYYGEPFGLTIDSKYGSGTTVSLTIPAKR